MSSCRPNSFQIITPLYEKMVYVMSLGTANVSKINQNFKKKIALSVIYCFPMCSGLFQFIKNINILQFTPFLVFRSHLHNVIMSTFIFFIFCMQCKLSLLYLTRCVKNLKKNSIWPIARYGRVIVHCCGRGIHS